MELSVSTFCADSYNFGVRSTPVLPQKQVKDRNHSAKSARVAGYSQVRMHYLTYVALHEVTWYMVVWCTQNLRRDGSSFMWHQPCQRFKYTAWVDIQKCAIKS